MRIALVQPTHANSRPGFITEKYFGFPLGLGYLAATLLRGGHEVRIFDPEVEGLSREQLLAALSGYKPDAVGVTSVTTTFMTAAPLAAEIKKSLGCPVIMGGAHVTALPRTSLADVPGLDAVIRGEGEVPILALADAFDKTGRVDFSSVPGAAYLAGGEYRENPLPPPVEDIDSLPYPARELVDMGRYQRMSGNKWDLKTVSVLSSRGCPSACTFCANICMGRRFRPRSPENFVDELEYICRKYGTKFFKIADDCFSADPARLAAICDLMISRRLSVTWDCAGRVNGLRDPELLRKMKRAGCRQVLLGIESGNQRILDLMRKGITLEAVKDCCAKLDAAGLFHIHGFILGAEGETEGTVRDTIAFSRSLSGLMAEFMGLIPYPGTEIFDRYYRDYDKPGVNWTDWCSSGPERPCELRQTELSWKQIRRWRTRAYLGYYLRPAQIARMLEFAFKL